MTNPNQEKKITGFVAKFKEASRTKKDRLNSEEFHEKIDQFISGSGWGLLNGGALGAESYMILRAMNKTLENHTPNSLIGDTLERDASILGLSILGLACLATHLTFSYKNGLKRGFGASTLGNTTGLAAGFFTAILVEEVKPIDKIQDFLYQNDYSQIIPTHNKDIIEANGQYYTYG